MMNAVDLASTIIAAIATIMQLHMRALDAERDRAALMDAISLVASGKAEIVRVKGTVQIVRKETRQ